MDYYDFRKMRSSGKYSFIVKKNKDGEKYVQMAKLPIGKPAPKFKVREHDGNSFTSKNSKGKVVVLNFWFTSCAPCIKELPKLNQLVIVIDYSKNKDVVFISITKDEKDKGVDFFFRLPYYNRCLACM